MTPELQQAIEVVTNWLVFGPMQPVPIPQIQLLLKHIEEQRKEIERLEQANRKYTLGFTDPNK